MQVGHELFGEIWNILSDKIPEKSKPEVANEYVNALLDYGINESTIESMMGICTHLDEAIEYVIDEEDDSEEYEEDEDWN